MATYNVDGMSCSGCEQNVEDALGSVSDVESVIADHENGTVTVTGEVDEEAVVTTIRNAGYDPVN